MSLKTALDNGILTIWLKGNVNFSNADELEQVLQGHIEKGSARILVDLSQASHIDSVALAVLLRMVTNAREKKGDLRLASVPQILRKTLQLASLDSAFGIYPNLEEAARF
ncbi:MAG: STAS domain-containing protein [Leptospirales bacterium]|nr:STAS domain-containing protein [Leptospirales bacterium]